jgi:hypothetical protein
MAVPVTTTPTLPVGAGNFQSTLNNDSTITDRPNPQRIADCPFLGRFFPPSNKTTVKSREIPKHLCGTGIDK